MGNRSANTIGIMLAVGLSMLMLFGWIRTMAPGHGEAAEVEAGYSLTMSLPEALGTPERGPAVFDHEAHLESVGEEGCMAEGCHEISDNMLSINIYEAGDDTTAAEYAEKYHDNCFGCHSESDGPIKKCGLCHVEKEAEQQELSAVELDLAQHQKHVAAMEEDCGACHHKYDEKKQELVAVEAEEATSCRDCHKEDADSEGPTLREAAHSKCVACHMTREEAGKDSGPVECAGCHADAGEVSPVMDMSGVKRLEAGQEDLPYLIVDDNNFDGVPFNHKGHEKIARNCRTCHHESLKACDECHTLKGSEDGGNVHLANAYHDPDSSHSCVGCHEDQKKQGQCAVCHSDMMKGPAEASCDTCHTGAISAEEYETASRRTPVDTKSLIPADLPETITISTIQETLNPVEFPHKQIILAMDDLIGDDVLANVFHGDRPVVCAACHHRSPLGEEPPRCDKCHADPFDKREPNKPGIKQAFHLQCVGCHRAMEVGDFRDCSGCHKDKDANLPYGSGVLEDTGAEGAVETEQSH